MTRPSGRRPSSGILGFFIDHPNAANLLMAMMILFGIVGALRMNTQFFPTVDVPRITVNIAWSGASARDVEANILDAVEPELRFLDGLDKITSYAREGAASITLEFVDGAEMQKALSDVETAVAGVTTLPEDSDDPLISRSIFYESVAKIALSGPFSEQALRVYAREIRDGLLDAGIDRVTFEGLRDREIHIDVSEHDLRRLGVSPGIIADRIGAAMRDMPSGTLEGDIEKQLRSADPPEEPAEIGAIEIVSGASGEKLLLRDIASVSTGFDEDEPIGFSGRNRAIELTVQRAETADTLATAEIFGAFMADIRERYPESLRIDVYDVRSDRLNERIMLLINNGLSGLVLVIIVLFLFLNARVAFWVAVGIPTALMATVGLMLVTGQTINMISLFAMIMMLGIIVDDAIVVGEETATLHRRYGNGARAAHEGARRMFWPVLAATLTTMAAFYPLFLVQDTVGQIMSALPFVVIVAVLASLLESFFILPGHLRHSLGTREPRISRFRQMLDGAFETFRERLHRPFVTLSYRWRYATVALAIASLIVTAGLVSGGRVGFQFFPSPESENLIGGIAFAAGTPQSDVAEAIVRIEDALYQAEIALTGGEEDLIVATYAVIGKQGFSRGMNLAQLEVQLTASEVRSVRTSDVVAEWRRQVPDIPGVERLTLSSRRGGPPGQDIEIQLTGADISQLKEAALEVRELLAVYPGVSSIGDDLPYGKPEIQFSLTPRGLAMGFTLESVSRQVRDAFEGAIARRFADGEDEVTVRVRRAQQVEGLAALSNLSLRAPGGENVPLGTVVTLEDLQGFSVIQRVDGETTVAVTADVDTDVVTPIEIVTALRDGPLDDLVGPLGIAYEFAGRDEERRESFADLQQGSLIALVAIYLILAWVFASYVLPVAVMLIIPFGFVGATIGHYVMGFPLTILSFMGLLGLSGILVNNSIILVKRIMERVDDGETIGEASVGGSCDRLRAVLLTSLTTIGGLIPLLMEESLQAQFLLPMAITLVFGLALATVFVLFLVPAFMGIGADIARAFRAIYGRPRQQIQPAE